VLVFGRTRRIRAHVTSVVAFVALFGLTIGLAEAVGRRYTFDPTRQGVHLPIAFAGGLATFAPLVTGWRRLRGRGSLGAHRAAIALFLALFVAATATGVAMMMTGTPRLTSLPEATRRAP
jgi:hypothetical protein